MFKMYLLQEYKKLISKLELKANLKSSFHTSSFFSTRAKDKAGLGGNLLLSVELQHLFKGTETSWTPRQVYLSL